MKTHRNASYEGKKFITCCPTHFSPPHHMPAHTCTFTLSLSLSLSLFNSLTHTHTHTYSHTMSYENVNVRTHFKLPAGIKVLTEEAFATTRLDPDREAAATPTMTSYSTPEVICWYAS